MEHLDRTGLDRRDSRVNPSLCSAHSIGGNPSQIPAAGYELLELAGLVHYVSEKLKWKFFEIKRTSWGVCEKYLYRGVLRCGFRNVELIRIATLKGLQVRATSIGRERCVPVCIMVIFGFIFDYRVRAEKRLGWFCVWNDNNGRLTVGGESTLPIVALR